MVGEPRTGRVLSIQRMSTEDGPGLRTTVFFKGCSLSCAWCHNPESIAVKPQVVWHDWKCMACHTCVEICPHDAARFDDHGAHRDPERCQVCGTCIAECPTTALEMVGTEWTVERLFDEVVKDRAYFGETGGVTMSGGEPTLQADFAGRFAVRCQLAGLHVALDTCGMCNSRALLDLLNRIDLLLYDLKILDSERHRQFTGQDNQLILDNLMAAADRLATRGRQLWIRTPLIPGATATDDNLTAIGGFLAGRLSDRVSRWELSPFNNLCQDKYRRLGMTWQFADVPTMTAAELAHCAAVARGSGVDPEIVHAEGSEPAAVASSSPAQPSNETEQETS